MTKSNVLCILGMHRSGTSVVTNWLHECGLNIGNRLLKADFSNKNGHFEDLDFLDLHKQILIDNGLNPTGLNNVQKINISPYFTKKIDSLINLKNNLNAEWGWKDPRTCLLIKEYFKRIPDLKIFVVHRPSLQTLSSLLNRDINRYLIQQNKSGIINKVKIHLVKKILIKKILNENLQEYIQSSTLYFNSILNIAKEINSSQILITSIDQIKDHESIIYQHLTNEWKFQLKKTPFCKIYQSGLTGKNELNKMLIDNYSKELQNLILLDDKIKKLYNYN